MDKIHLPHIYPVACHTNNVGPGSLFVVIQGAKENGLAYIEQALKQGATSIALEQSVEINSDLEKLIDSFGAKIIRVENARKALAELSAEKLNYPSKKLEIIGITGTKGKSTTTFIIEHILKQLGYKTAMLSTVKNRIGDQDLPTQLTTQLPDYLHVFFDECVKQDVEFVVMEVAAQALSLHRVHGVEFTTALFTNFSQEHFEFYDSLETYFKAKAHILNHLSSSSTLVLNSDDDLVSRLNHGNVIHFGNTGSIKAEIEQNNLLGLRLKILIDGKVYPAYAPSLVGSFNVYNILGALSVIKSLGISMQDAIKALETFKGVPGRLQRINLPNGSTAFIDYAHNPSSFEAVLSTLRSLSENLIVVFGAGGERDPYKRPIMGKIASQFADIVILTSDNPRSEDPQEIAYAIQAGVAPEHLPKVQIELDRETAIKKAYALSTNKSMIVLLGKGPDEYQLVKGVKTYFSEAKILQGLP